MFDPRRGHPTVPELVQDAFEPFFLVAHLASFNVNFARRWFKSSSCQKTSFKVTSVKIQFKQPLLK